MNNQMENAALLSSDAPAGLFLQEPEAYKGSFKWQGDPNIDIPLYKQDHDVNDPATWPLIRKYMAPKRPQIQKELPPYFAYEGQFMEEMLKFNKMIVLTQGWVPITPLGKGMNLRFCYYPYNFDESGTLRQEVGMTAQEYKNWIIWKTGKTPARSLEQQVKYENIMRKLDDTVPAPAVSQLKTDLKKAKNDLDREKNKVSITEKENKALKASLDAEANKQQEMERNYKALEKELESVKNELESSKKETAEANDRLNSIWDKLNGGDWSKTRRSGDESDVSHVRKDKRARFT